VVVEFMDALSLARGNLGILHDFFFNGDTVIRTAEELGRWKKISHALPVDNKG
jgi:hypothetical protein